MRRNSGVDKHVLAKNAVGLSKLLIGGILINPEVVVDATLGNGHDLHQMMQTFPTIRSAYGFDVQLDAIQSSVTRLSPVPDGVELHLIHDSHANFSAYLIADMEVDLFTYNLGYLPGGDKSITTESSTVLSSLDVALHYLRTGGVISVVCYPGHPSGRDELDRICEWSSKLSQKHFAVSRHGFINQVNNPPEIILIQRISL